MSIEEYKSITKKILPKTMTFKKLFLSFFVGGLIGLLAQILIMFYSSFESIIL